MSVVLHARTGALFVAFAAFLVLEPASATEAPVQRDAHALLGADAKGDNWTVAPIVASDGFVRIYSLDTPYGTFQVSSQRRLDERLHELRALQTLEKMSRTKVLVDAVAKAGLAPLRFGRDLVLDPVGTAGNLVNGVGNMFDSAVTTVSDTGSRRDPLFNNLVGITKAERDLAVTLGVDPYSDFLPLRNGLRSVARVMAAGDISVSAALSAIPGGAGIAVSASSTASALNSSVYSKTSDEIAAEVTKKLAALGVEQATIQMFVGNHVYTPADQFAVADALEKLGADNSEAFVSRSAAAADADVAKLYRYRAELLAKESSRLGSIKSFTVVSGALLNRNADGELLAVFPFDDVTWTDRVSGSLTRVSAEIAKTGEAKSPVLAATGTMSEMAETELKKLGWTLVPLNMSSP
ncbi:MAG: hypothetical protein HY243_17680 [Proteobacteria bacterium]|nr:hypothetical protein [Pseudomonadota bacterium]